MRRTETQKIRNKIRTITKKTVIGLTCRLQARSPADPNKKNVLPETTRSLPEKISGDLDDPGGLPRAHGGRRIPGVESDSALRRLDLREPFVGDP
jgi:hypothetical protein